MSERVPDGAQDTAELERSQRARARRLGCVLGIFLLATVGSFFAFKLYLLGTPPGGGAEPSGESTGR